MDPKDRIAECLSTYQISDARGNAVSPAHLAEVILDRLGTRKRIYSCVRQDLEVPCEHQEHEIEIIVLKNDW